MNKKAQIEDFIEYFIVAIAIIIIVIVITIAIKSHYKDIEDETIKSAESAIGQRTTRILLTDEIDGEKLYQRIIKNSQNHNYDAIVTDIKTAINLHHPAQTDAEWMIRIVDENGLSKQILNGENRDLPSFSEMPGIKIPNPNGQDIDVLIKPVNPIDLKSTWGPIITMQETEYEYSDDGKNLVSLTGFKNIHCQDTKRSVCKASPQLKQKLEELDEYLGKEGITMNINSAYRTWQMQYSLYVQFGQDRSKACAPGTKEKPSSCPHMTGGAIDINMIDSEGLMNRPGDTRNLNSKVEKIMCEHGFVRYAKEHWHFEYGTTRWQRAGGGTENVQCALV